MFIYRQDSRQAQKKPPDGTSGFTADACEVRRATNAYRNL